MIFGIDSNNNETDRTFFFRTNTNFSGGTTLMTITEGGTYTFDQLTAANQTQYLCFNTSTKVMTYDNSACGTSDERLKTNIQTLAEERGLEAILKLNPVTFNWKDASSTPELELGFIAQEVREVFPDLVVDRSGTTTIVLLDGTVEEFKPLKLKYDGLIAPLVRAVQELNKKLDDGLAALATTTLASGPTNAWSVDQTSGKVNVNFYGDINANGNNLLNVAKIVNANGRIFLDEAGNISAKDITAESVTTGKLNVGSEATPAGIMLYDTVTKQPYCVSITNGEFVKTSGSCAASSAPDPVPAPAGDPHSNEEEPVPVSSEPESGPPAPASAGEPEAALAPEGTP